MDLLYAYKQIDEVKKIISDLRKVTVKDVFESMLEMAKIANLDGMPTRQRQTTRSNVEASSPKDYWQRTIFIDHLLEEFENRFSQLAVKGFHLVPSQLPKGSESIITTRYKDDLPSPASFKQEIRMWKILWADIETPPSSLSQ